MTTYNLSLVRGDSSTISFTILGENGKDYIADESDKLYFTVKEDVEQTDALLQLTLENQGIIYNTETKEYEIKIAPDDTNNLPFSRFVYDIELVIIRDDRRLVKTLVKGCLTISEEVTHKENEI